MRLEGVAGVGKTWIYRHVREDRAECGTLYRHLRRRWRGRPRLGISGTPAEVIDQIHELADAGVNEVNPGGPLCPAPEEAIRLMGKEVIPAFRK